MENISKKKSFFKELIKQFLGKEILFFGIILYFIIAGIIGYSVTNYQNISLRVLKGMGIGFLILFIGMTIIFVELLLIEVITFNINKIKAIKRYTYLPLTVEEINQSIKNGLFSTEESYIKYICDQLRYKSLWGSFDYASVKFTNADLILLCRSVEEVYEQPVVLNYNHYLYCMPYNYTSPFAFIVGIYNIDDAIWDADEENEIVIFCTDKSKVKDYVEVHKNIKKYTLYDVENANVESFNVKQ